MSLFHIDELVTQLCGRYKYSQGIQNTVLNVCYYGRDPDYYSANVSRFQKNEQDPEYVMEQFYQVCEDYFLNSMKGIYDHFRILLEFVTYFQNEKISKGENPIQDISSLKVLLNNYNALNPEAEVVTSDNSQYLARIFQDVKFRLQTHIESTTTDIKECKSHFGTHFYEQLWGMVAACVHPGNFDESVVKKNVEKINVGNDCFNMRAFSSSPKTHERHLKSRDHEFSELREAYRDLPANPQERKIVNQTLIFGGLKSNIFTKMFSEEFFQDMAAASPQTNAEYIHNRFDTDCLNLVLLYEHESDELSVPISTVNRVKRTIYEMTMVKRRVPLSYDEPFLTAGASWVSEVKKKRGESEETTEIVIGFFVLLIIVFLLYKLFV